MEEARSKQVLVAVRPQVRQVACDLLEPDYALTYCDTLEEAISQLENHQYDLVFCTLRFDHSKMFELIAHIRSTAHLKDMPFAAVRLSGGILSDDIVDNVMRTAKLMGADVCVNLPLLQRQLGNTLADNKLHMRLHEIGFCLQ